MLTNDRITCVNIFKTVAEVETPQLSTPYFSKKGHVNREGIKRSPKKFCKHLNQPSMRNQIGKDNGFSLKSRFHTLIQKSLILYPPTLPTCGIRQLWKIDGPCPNPPFKLANSYCEKIKVKSLS
jgi:hypothetical protein